jgi:hypothetical protein
MIMENKTYFAVILLCHGHNEFTNKDENENPVLFSNRKDAWKDIADTQMSTLQSFMDGMKDVDDEQENESYLPMFELDYSVVEVTMTDRTIRGTADDGEEMKFTAAKSTKFWIEPEGQDRKYLYEDLTAEEVNAYSRNIITDRVLEKMWADNWDEKDKHGLWRKEFFEEAEVGDVYNDGIYKLIRTA